MAGDQSIQHGDGVIGFMLDREFNGTVGGVEMLSEAVNHIMFHGDQSSTYLPQYRGGE